MSHIHSASQRLGPLTFLWIALFVAIVGSGFWGGRWLKRVSGARSHPVIASASNAEHRQARAEVLYQSLCAACHGSEGMGDGAAALSRPPRAFPQDDWLFPKTAKSIRRVIADGIPDGMMPGFRQTISGTEIELLADHVLRLAARQEAAAFPQPLHDAIEAAGFKVVAPRPAPSITVRTTDGHPIALDDLKGKPVLLHFWGTACVHCLAEFASLGELDAIDQIQLLSICIDQSDPEAVDQAGRPFAGEHPLFVDESGLAGHRFQVQALPAYFLIDAQGRLVATRTGAGGWAVPPFRTLMTQLAEPSR